MDSFERILSVSAEEIEFDLSAISALEWQSFFLNPRRLRGSDFLMRWSQGEWSEKRLIEAVNRTGNYYALPYGPSGTAPAGDVRAFELYFERLDHAGLGKIKRPDLLIFKASRKELVDRIVHKLGGLPELPFTPEDKLAELLAEALLSIECENSLWKSGQMPNFMTPLTPQRRLGGKMGLKKAAVLPTVILKEEDRTPLIDWQNVPGRPPIHIWHVFFDQAFGLSLNEANRLISEGLIEPIKQTFQAPGGATTVKIIYKIYYQYAYRLGRCTESPELSAKLVEDKNGHILPFVTFTGGQLDLDDEALAVLRNVDDNK